jgi:hypothetical protein
MNVMADDLRALGETITDRHLVLNLLQGLNKRFDHMKIFIKRLQLFLSFHTVHNDLKLEKIELDNSVAQGQASSFYSAPSGAGRPPQQLLPLRPPQQEPPCSQVASPPPVPNPNTGGKGKGKEKGKGKNNHSGGFGNSSGNNSRGAPVWSSFYNPWTGTISMWPGMCPPQQPARPPQHALLVAPTYYGAPGGPSFAPLPVTSSHQQQSDHLPGLLGWARGINSHWPTPSTPWP